MTGSATGWDAGPLTQRNAQCNAPGNATAQFLPDPRRRQPAGAGARRTVTTPCCPPPPGTRRSSPHRPAGNPIAPRAARPGRAHARTRRTGRPLTSGPRSGDPSSATSTSRPSGRSITTTVTAPPSRPDRVCSTAFVTSSDVSRTAVSAAAPASRATNALALATCSGHPGMVRLPRTTASGIMAGGAGQSPDDACSMTHSSPYVGYARISRRSRSRMPGDIGTQLVMMSLPCVRNDDGPNGRYGASA